MKHYKDGEFHKDYDRQLTAASFVNFLRDPAGEIPWEEDENGKDVVHLIDSDVIQSNNHMFLALNRISMKTLNEKNSVVIPGFDKITEKRNTSNAD